MKQLSRLALLFLSCWISDVAAQTVNNYAFVPASSTFTALSGATSATITGGGGMDEGYANLLPIGFTFYYNSVPYTTISVSTNGYVSLGQSMTAINSYVNNLAAGTSPLSPRPIIAPLWDDLSFVNTTDISYQTTGSSPSRVFSIQWLNAKWQYNSTGVQISFQLKLYEADSRIEFIYRPESGALLNPSASIGITNAASGAGNFLSITSTANNPFDTSTVSETTTLGTKPANGQRYSFVPKYTIPPAPSAITFSGVTPTSLNLNWTDNATSETYYRILVSTDNVNFSLYSIINSTTSSGTGAAYQVPVTGLNMGTTYYFQVYPCNEGSAPVSFATASQATTGGVLSGIKSICPSGCDYTSVGNAANAIRTMGVNGSLILELDATYSPSVETYPLNFGNLLTNASNTAVLRPKANVTSAISFIWFASNSQTFDFNGTRYFTIDGRRGGTGAPGYINISNLSSSGTAIRFTNDATNNAINYCRISGATGSTTSGVITFGSTTGTAGNSNNTISNCVIKDTISNPIYAVYSSGNASYPNLNNTISNNNIYDYFNGSNATYGIFMTTGTDAWTINNNHFYQTATRTLSFNAAGAIYVAAGASYMISGNFIGGSAPSCGGSAMDYDGTGTIQMLNLNLPTNNTCNIQGNTIANIRMNMTGTPNAFVNMANGAFNVTGNIIGSSASLSSISFSSTATDVLFAPVSLSGGSSYGNITIGANSIGGISIGGTGTVIFRGINIASSVPALTINGNLIGSQTMANSINDSTNQGVYGISATLNSTNNIISSNIICNLSSLSTQTANRLCGIFASSTGTFTITGNLVKNLVTGTTSTANGVNTPLVGIFHNASGSNQICSQNHVNGLISTNTTLAMTLCGIYYAGSATGSNIVARNLVHGIISLSSGASVVSGLLIGTSASSIYNNMVRLGLDTSGGDITANHSFFGINDGANSTSYYHNSVYIGGSGVTTGSNITAAFYNSAATNGTRVIANNIFSNERSNNSGSGKNYAVFLTSTTLTGFAINYNIYYSPGIGGALGRFNSTDYTILNTWRAAVFNDFNSGIGDPDFLLPLGSSSAFSLKVKSPTPAEGSGVFIGISDDWEGDLRSTLTPSDIGADAGNFVGVDIFSPAIVYTPLTNTASTSNRTLTSTITDVGTGVRNSASLQPRIWFRRSQPTVSSWFSAAGTLVSGNGNNGTWSFTIDYSLIGGAVTVGNQYQYYIVAQDSASPINLFYNPLPGASHTNVFNQVTAPTNPASYAIVNGLSTTINVGTGQTYTTLTGAGGLFNAINTGALSGNTVATIVSDITEPATFALSNAGMGGFTLTIKPDNSLRTLSGATNGTYGLVTLNGASGVTIDGGVSRNLVIRNAIGSTPVTTTPAVWIYNGNYDTLRNCILETNNSSNGSATLLLSNASAATSCTGIVVANNTIRPANNVNTNLPSTGILVFSAAGNISNTTISGNQIIDFTNYGMYIANAGNNLVIGHPTDTAGGNSVFQTAARGTHYNILVGSGNNHVVGCNKIYSSPGVSHTGAVYGIYVFNNINNITVVNNSLGGSGTTRAGAAYSMSANFAGISFFGGSLGTSSITNNIIGNIAMSGATTFTGIQTGSGNVNITNNKVGGASVTFNAYDTIGASQDFYGIRHATSSNLTMTGNTVSNIRNSGIGFTTCASIEGGVANVNGNTFRNILVTGTNNTAADLSCNGIRVSTTTSGNNIENNVIFDLSNSSNTGSASVCGIAVTGAINLSTVHRNRIYNLTTPGQNGGATSPLIWGIYIGSSGSATYANNQISISQSIAGTQPRIRGIELITSGGTNNFYYNTVYVGGVANTANTTNAFYRNTTSGTPALNAKNNIFYNERTGSGPHYAMSASFNSNFINDNNLFVAAGAAVEYPVGTGRSVASWNTVSGNPVNNLSTPAGQLNSSLFFPNLSSGDLATTACRVSNAGTPVSITGDYSNFLRSATAPDIGSVEFSGATGMPAISANPSSPSATCPLTGSAYFNVTASGYGITYQWEENPGSGWNALVNNSIYSGVSTASLTITGPTTSMNNYQYRCTVSGVCTPAVSSSAATLSVFTVNTWTGAVSTAWGNLANWNCGFVPTGSTNILIPNTTNQPVVSDGGRFVNNITINAGGSLTLNNALSNLTVSGTFINNGTVTASGGMIVFNGTAAQVIPSGSYYDVTISNAANVSLTGTVSISGTLNFTSGVLSLNGNNLNLLGTTSAITGTSATSFIVTPGATGNLSIQNIGVGGRTGAVVFPISAVAGGPVTPLTITNSGTADTYSARMVQGVHTAYSSGTPAGSPITTGAVGATWIISEATAGGGNIALNLQWPSTMEYSGFSRSNCYIARYNGSTWMSSSSGAASGTDPYNRTLSGITSTLSSTPFGVGTGTVLPVGLIEFVGKRSGNNVDLAWKTTSEVNNDRFEIERSFDGKIYERVGMVKGSGTSSTVNVYSFTDQGTGSLPVEELYYRLRQVDADGSVNMSHSIVIRTGNAAHPILVTPNPSDKELTISGFASDAGSVSVVITDMNGKAVVEWEGTLLPGAFSIPVAEASSLDAGVYFLNIRIGGRVETHKVIRLK